MRTKLVFRTNDSRPGNNMNVKCHDSAVTMFELEAVHKQCLG